MTEFIPPGTRFLDLPSPFPMKRGGALHGARIAYETWANLVFAERNCHSCPILGRSSPVHSET